MIQKRALTQTLQALQNDRFGVFAEDVAQRVGDFADRRVGIDSSHNRGHQIFSGASAPLNFGRGCAGALGIAAGAQRADPFDLLTLKFRIDAHRRNGRFLLRDKLVYADDDLLAAFDGALVFVRGFLNFALHISGFDPAQHAAQRVNPGDVFLRARFDFIR